MKYKLIYERDDDTGELGFRIDGSKMIAGAYNMANDGVLIAHDITEHRAINKIGTIGDELMALGGVWYVRGQHGELRRDGTGSAYTPAQNVASDVANMGRDIVLGYKKYNEKLPRVQVNGHLHLEDFQDIISEARKTLKSELQGEEYTIAALDDYLDKALKYMIAGFNHVQKRFSKLGNFAANNIFWNITEAVDQCLKHAEFEGQEFELNIVFNKNQVTHREIYEV